VGRWLTRFLRDAGFTEIQLEALALHSDDTGLAETFPQLDPAPLAWLAAAGHLSEAERAAFDAARAGFLASPEPFALVLSFMACGVRPDAPS